MGQSWTKAHDSSKNTFWENYPSIASPIIDTELNRNEVSVDTVDDRVITLDTTKAEQSDLLQAFKDVSLDSTTGVITFTLFNNTTKTIDTLLEKIAINFDYDDNPSSPHYQNLVIELEDGTYKYIDMSALITQYEFTNSSCISWTIGNDGSVTANIIDGSITGAKLQPNYLADCLSAKSGAENAEADAIAKALVAEGYANGKQNGVPVTSGSPYYENNAEYFKDQAQSIVGSKVDSFNGRTGVVTPQTGDYSQDMISVPTGASVGQVPTVRSDGQGGLEFQMEMASAGMLPHLVITSDTGSTVSATKGGTIYTATETSTGIFEVDVDDYGTWTINSDYGGVIATDTITIDSVKIYSITVLHFVATITVTYPSGATVTCSDGDHTYTATGSPHTFTVTNPNTWTISCSKGGVTRTASFSITTTGQTESVDMTPTGSTVTPVNDVETLCVCAGIWDSSLSTIALVLADTTATQTILNDQNAVDYLVRSTNLASSVCGNQNAMSKISNNNTTANKLLDDSTWRSAICNSTYWATVLNTQVPVMTSASAPSGSVAVSNTYSGNGYQGFDRNANTGWHNNWYDSWIQYTFTSNVKVYKMCYQPWQSKCGGWTDNGEFYVMRDFVITADGTQVSSGRFSQSRGLQYHNISSPKSAKAYRLRCTNTWSNGSYTGEASAGIVNFYGRSS